MSIKQAHSECVTHFLRFAFLLDASPVFGLAGLLITSPSSAATRFRLLGVASIAPPFDNNAVLRWRLPPSPGIPAGTYERVATWGYTVFLASIPAMLPYSGSGMFCRRFVMCVLCPRRPSAA